MLDVTGLIPWFVGHSLIFFLTSLGSLYLECNESVFCTGESHFKDVRFVPFQDRTAWGADGRTCVWLCSDNVKHVITVWWVLWQYDISCCWWIGTDFWLYYFQWVRFKQFMCSHAQCIYDCYILQVRVFKCLYMIMTWFWLGIHSLVCLAAQGTWIDQWSMWLIVIIICKDISVMEMSVCWADGLEHALYVKKAF